MKWTTLAIVLFSFVVCFATVRADDASHTNTDNQTTGNTQQQHPVAQPDPAAKLYQLISSCLLNRPGSSTSSISLPPQITGTTSGSSGSSTAVDPAAEKVYEANCAGCHGSMGNPTLDTFDADRAKTALQYIDLPTDASMHMPQGKTLSDSDKQTLKAWLQKKANS